MNNGTGSNIGANLIVAALGTAVLAPIQTELYAESTPGVIVPYEQLRINSWDDVITLSEYNYDTRFHSLSSFSETLLSNTKDIEPEILKVVNKNFWDLL